MKIIGSCLFKFFLVLSPYIYNSCLLIRMPVESFYQQASGHFLMSNKITHPHLMLDGIGEGQMEAPLDRTFGSL